MAAVGSVATVPGASKNHRAFRKNRSPRDVPCPCQLMQEHRCPPGPEDAGSTRHSLLRVQLIVCALAHRRHLHRWSHVPPGSAAPLPSDLKSLLWAERILIF